MFSPPQGPLPPEIYRRRRIAAVVVLVVVLLVLGGIVMTVRRLGADETTAPASTTTPASTTAPASATVPASGSATTSATPLPSAGACARANLEVSIEISPAVAPGHDAELVMRVRNTGDRACDVDLGPANQRYEVYTLDQQYTPVWSSANCNQSTQHDSVTLQPAAPAVYRYIWRGTVPNSVGVCPEPTAPPVAPGDYLAYGLIGDVSSRPVPFAVR